MDSAFLESSFWGLGMFGKADGVLGQSGGRRGIQAASCAAPTMPSLRRSRARDSPFLVAAQSSHRLPSLPVLGVIFAEISCPWRRATWFRTVDFPFVVRLRCFTV